MIETTSKIDVTKVTSMGGDYMVVAAAKVSTNAEDALKWAAPENAGECAGLINYLMKHRHGTPFEHSAMTFFVDAPIKVFREWHRHRVGFSYNEESGRYSVLRPKFYLPDPSRPMFKVDNWKAGRPKFLTIQELAAHNRANDIWPDTASGGGMPLDYVGDPEQFLYDKLCENLMASYALSYANYLKNLAMGFDPGLARDCLPVGIYSRCWVTCNPRSMMAFLSLRTHDPEALFVSYPLYEIEAAAKLCEQILAEGWPLTYAAFNANKRVGP
jgi:thymidylate synthase (FAD)